MRSTLRSVLALLTLLLAVACAPQDAEPSVDAPAAGPVGVPVDDAEDAPANGAAAERADEPEAPTAMPERDEWVVLETDQGEVWINLFEERSPEHAENFKKLVRQGWYDGSPFHRVIAGFVAQGGGKWVGETGLTSDVGYEIAPEIRGDLRHVRGALAAARTSDAVNPRRRSSGSQFYICLRPQPELDQKYTVFGQVIHGLDVVDRLESGPPGKNGILAPGEASVILRAWLRPANEPGSAAPDDHSDHSPRPDKR